MNKNNYHTSKKIGDYTGFCDTCGMPFWASEGTILDTYTGLGGAWVCPTCVDPIDYGLVPFKVLPEEPVRESRATTAPTNTIDPANLDFTTIDPMSINNPTTDPRLT